MMDDAEETMGFVWQEFAHRFVGFAADRAAAERAAADRTAADRTASGPAARGVRLPIVTSET
jgi:hypothetical protein